MSRTNELAIQIAEVDDDLLGYFINTWSEFCPTDQTLEQYAQSIEEEFNIKCSADDVVRLYAGQIEEEDVKCQMANLNLYQ